MIFAVSSAFVLEADHDVAWFDVPMDEFLLVDGSQTGGDLRRNLEGQLTSSWPSVG